MKLVVRMDLHYDDDHQEPFSHISSDAKFYRHLYKQYKYIKNELQELHYMRLFLCVFFKCLK